MDVIVCAAIDDMLRLVHIPCITAGIARRHRRICCCDGQIVVVPGAIEPEFMDVIVRAAIDDMLRLVHAPGIPKRIARRHRRICC